jgi:hypothetical protein
MPLVCFCYGPPAWARERATPARTPAPLAGDSLAALTTALAADRAGAAEQVSAWLAATPAEEWDGEETERLRDLRLHTVEGRNFAGQFVEDGQGVVYASLFARPDYVAALA